MTFHETTSCNYNVRKIVSRVMFPSCQVSHDVILRSRIFHDDLLDNMQNSVVYYHALSVNTDG